MKNLLPALVVLTSLSFLVGCSDGETEKKLEQAKTECRTLEHAIQVYVMMHNGHNVSKDEVLQLTVEDGILKEKRVPKDPWGRDYVVTFDDDSNQFTVHSMGDNGSDGDEDDVFSDGLRKDRSEASEASEARRASERWSISEWSSNAWQGTGDYMHHQRVAIHEFYRRVGKPFRIQLNEGNVDPMSYLSLYWSCKDGVIQVKVTKYFYHRQGELFFAGIFKDGKKIAPLPKK